MQYFSMTDVGMVREINQDYVYASDSSIGNLPNLFIVADGMGGHKAGDYASKYTVERILELAAAARETDPCILLDRALMQINTEIVRIAASDPDKQGMGTTFVGCSIADGLLKAVNVGDSRLYVIGEGITQVTVDHSYVQEMVDKGEIDAAQARNHPNKNIITRAVGGTDIVAPDYFEYELSPGDLVLLCSDGLTNMLEDDEIRDIVTSAGEPEAICRALIDAANAAGGADNISAVIVAP